MSELIELERLARKTSAFPIVLVPRATILRIAARDREKDEEIERLRAALGECQDKLWIARCDSGDKQFRAVAERACDMARDALKGASQ